MWRGVKVIDGMLNLEGSIPVGGRTTIQDAFIAVQVESNGSLDCYWTLFQKNKVCVKVPPHIVQNEKRDVPLTFIATLFEGGGVLLNGEMPDIGIELNDVKMVNLESFFASIFAFRVDFDGFNTGLLARNSGVMLTKVPFTNMNVFGINASNNSIITYEGKQFTPPNGSPWLCNFPSLFFNMPTAINISDSDLNIKGATIKNVGNGIICRQISHPRETVISKSCIEARMNGCVVFAGLNVAGEITDNTIRVSTNGTSLGAGISIEDISPNVGQHTGVWKITGNELTVSKNRAILARNADNVQIRANKLIQNTALNKPAISIEGGNSNEVECNHNILSNGAGIVCANSISPDIDCNSVSAGAVGLNFFGDCSKAKIRGNSLTGGTYDLAYGSNNQNFATTGLQNYVRNRFLGSGFAFIQAINYEPNPFIAERSRYIVDVEGSSPCPEDQALLPFFESSDELWFRDLPSQNSCIFQYPSQLPNGQCIEVNGPPNGYVLDEKDAAVRDNTWGLNYLSEAARWDARRYLYRDLNSMTVVPTTYQNYYQNEGSSTVGQFRQYENSLRSTVSLPISTEQAIQQNRVDRADMVDDFYAIQEWTYQNGNLVQNPVAIAQKQALLNSIVNLDNQWIAIMAAHRQQIMGQITALIAQNNAITASEDHEQNQKTLNAYHLKLLQYGAGYQPSPVEQMTIEQIALQCPLEGGVSVYQARAIMDGISEGYDYDDEILCDNGQRPALSTKQMTNNDFLIFPNPANDLLHIRFHETQLMQLTVFDSHGRTMRLEKSIVAGSTDISVVTWSSGLYMLVVRDANGYVSARRFTVNH